MPSVFTEGAEGEMVRSIPPIGKRRRGIRVLVSELKLYLRIRKAERLKAKRGQLPPERIN